MNWYIKRFKDLTVSELYELLQERVNVFVVEQNCPYPEVDGKDQECFHLFAEEDGGMIAYARLLPAGVAYPQAAIGRVLVKQKYRKTGLGKQLMERSMDFFKNELNETEIKLQAQEYALDFYGSFGFKTVSEVYLEDDIPHADMIWKQ